MAEANIVKGFRWRLEIAGVDNSLFQEVKLPDAEWAEIMHQGDSNDADIKTPGRKKISDLTIKKLKASTIQDAWIWSWFDSVGITVRSAYARFGYLKELDESGFKVVAVYDLGEIWPKKINGSTYKKGGDGENVIEEIVFSVSRFQKAAL